MQTEKLQNLIERSLRQADNHFSTGNYGRAFANYGVVLRLGEADGNDETIREKFVFSLGKLGQELEKNGKIPDLFRCYEQALDLLPADENLLTCFGAQLLRLGCFEEASYYLGQALAVNPASVVAQEHLETIANALVERWHFTMLNCVERNAAFRNAIEEAVSENHGTVLDIGTGTGILSMFAVQSGATEVYACEMSQTMFRVAAETLKLNGMHERVKLIHGKSTSLRIPENIPERVSLVVTETFDAGLFGEHILETLTHAWEKLLLRPSDVVGRFGGIVVPKSADVWACLVEAKRIRQYSRLLPEASFVWNVSHKPVMKERKHGDVYTTERLSWLRHGHRNLCLPTRILQVNFNDLEELRALQRGRHCDVPVFTTTDGIADAVVVWFDLHLSDTATVSSGPDSATCWEQAVFPSASAYDVEVSPDQNVVLGVRCQRSLDVTFSLRSENASEVQPEPLAECTGRLEGLEIAKLNDVPYQSALKDAFEAAVSSVESDVRLLLLTSMPLLALYAARQPNVSAVGCPAESQSAIRKFYDDERCHRYDKFTFDVRQPLAADRLQWNVLVADVVEPYGVLNVEALRDIVLYQAQCRQSQCCVIPGKVRCMAALIESAELEKQNRVMDDGKTLGLRIWQHINSYSVSLHQDIDLNTLVHVKLTDATAVLVLDFMEPLPALESSEVVPVTVNRNGRVTAVAFWFELDMRDGCTLSTLDPRCHWNHAAVVLKHFEDVTRGQVLAIGAKCESGRLSMSLVECAVPN